MTRLIAGSAGGQRLDVPPVGTRPTSDRVREAIFSRLDHLGVLEGTRVLDLYAGSGALGLEAASRGAARVTLVESGRSAVGICRTNARRTGLADRVEVVAAPVERYLGGRPPAAGYDVVLIDPPYAAAIEDVLSALSEPGWLAPEATIVLERSTRSPAPAWPPGWSDDGTKSYGETSVHYALVP
ncbi:16S rRNA (guanine(966)-N(2))-methyltransferase RsmD [Ruania suaedae]|uniref:16S rRNA (guanine(966)-N(2))-methyltransferase RsmD n=1 Tax=Ruania suaedae TaxID=2897774 RepID=UPI001E415805|nr:16S rRNA (guanine(966)-N(2))-methyltransferase RsmD [Ruania suaedae]UFU01982.1 16S rRNA (guanine(966)-N(2))-methyltransferase RsmD [Ruania suaedae]